MPKIIALLEKYVEYVALGIGAVFFLLVGWLYFQPVSQSVHFGPQTVDVTVANVDEKIEKGPAEELQGKISQAQANVPKFTVEKFGARIERDLSMSDATDATLVTAVMDQQPWKADVKIIPTTAGQVVNALPDLPPAMPFAVLCGTSTVDAPPTGILANPAAAPAATAAPQPIAPPPGPAGLFQGGPGPGPGPGGMPMPMDVPPPSMMAAPGGGNPAGPLAGGVRTDVVWNTVMFVIPAAPLVKAWNDSFGPDPKTPNNGWRLPQNTCLTAILDVALIREVKNGDNWQPDDTTGNPNGVVSRLFNDVLSPLPAANDRAGVTAYFSYAKTQAGLITAPPFPTQSTAPSGTRIPDPTTFLPQLLVATPKPAAAPGSAGSPPFEPAAPVEPLVLTSPNLKLAAQPAVLADSFNPATVGATPMKDILVWLHDTTTMPGRVYRYRLSYKLQNPLYFAPAAIAKDPKWSQQVTLDSKLSPPSVEVTSHARVRYFCAQNMLLNDSSFKFDIFAWANGAMHKRQFTVERGDIIGGKFDEGTPDGIIDYGTGVTLVYVHNSNNRIRVITADPDGRINVREVQSDWGDKERHWLDAQITAMKPKPADAPPMPSMPPGMPGGMPGMPPNFPRMPGPPGPGPGR